MVKFSKERQIYLYSKPTDMRMGLPKIQILVGANFTRAEIVTSIYIFCSQDRKQIKIYYEDEYGAWLLQNRLFDSKFKLPKELETGVVLTKKQLEGFLHGLDVIDVKPPLRLEDRHYI